MAVDEGKKLEMKNESKNKENASESRAASVSQTVPVVGQPQQNKGIGGGLLAFVICSYIVGACNVVTALYYTMKSLFLGWNDYTSILNAIVSIVMAVCFLTAAIEMTKEKHEGKRLAQIALIAALVCSVITAVPGIVDGFPGPSVDVYLRGAINNEEDSLAAEQALYVVTWAMIFVVRAGLVGLLLAYLEKSERVKNTLVK